jgi:hypothetical protein
MEAISEGHWFDPLKRHWQQNVNAMLVVLLEVLGDDVVIVVCGGWGWRVGGRYLKWRKRLESTRLSRELDQLVDLLGEVAVVVDVVAREGVVLRSRDIVGPPQWVGVWGERRELRWLAIVGWGGVE